MGFNIASAVSINQRSQWLRECLHFSGILCVAIGLSGCFSRVAIEDLSSPPTSGPRANVVYAANSSTIADGYRLWGEDVLVVRSSALTCGGGSGGYFSNSKLVTEKNRIRVISERRLNEIRLPLQALISKENTSIVVSGVSSSGAAIYNATFSLPIPITSDGFKTWKQFYSELKDFKNCPAAVSLEPAEPAYAAPGDTIEVTRTLEITDAYSGGGGTGARRAAEHFLLTVDQGGAVTLPAPTRVPTFPTRYSSNDELILEEAMLDGAFSAAYSKLDVVSRPLSTLAVCLSSELLAGKSSECNGIDSRHAIDASTDGPSLRDARYIIDPGPRTWSLIDESGRVYTFPFTYGLTILGAVADAYRTSRGLELLRTFHRTAYITVVPQSGRPPLLEPPFFGKVTGPSLGNPLAELLIRPGDTIHVNYSKPKAISSTGVR